MNEQEIIKSKQLNRTAIILRTYAIIFLVLSFVCNLIPVLQIVFIFILIIISMATLFLLFLNPQFKALFDNTAEFLNSNAAKIISYSLYFSIAALSFASLSLVLTLLSKNNINKKKNTASLILLYVLIAVSLGVWYVFSNVEFKG